MPNSEQNVEECGATWFHSSNVVWAIKITALNAALINEQHIKKSTRIIKK